MMKPTSFMSKNSIFWRGYTGTFAVSFDKPLFNFKSRRAHGSNSEAIFNGGVPFQEKNTDDRVSTRASLSILIGEVGYVFRRIISINMLKRCARINQKNFQFFQLFVFINVINGEHRDTLTKICHFFHCKPLPKYFIRLLEFIYDLRKFLDSFRLKKRRNGKKKSNHSNDGLDPSPKSGQIPSSIEYKHNLDFLKDR